MKLRILIAAVILLGIGFYVFNRLGGEAVAVTRPVRGQAVQAVYSTGTVEASVMIPIAPKVSARLVELKVDEGDKVTKGQLLARQEDGDLEYALQQFKAKEEFAETEYKRNEELLKNKSVSRQLYEQAKSNLLAAQAATGEARAKLDYLKIIAPEDGEIIKRDGEVGQLLSTTTPLFWMSASAPLRISAEVDEEDIAQVKVGQEVLIRADAFPEKIFHGKVQAITPKGDPVARSYRVRVEFGEEVPLLIGMTAEINIIIDKKDNALLVPSSAIAKNKVFVLRDGRAVEQKVAIGVKSVDKTEIIDGVAEGDVVIVKPDAKMKDGKKINPVFSENNKP